MKDIGGVMNVKDIRLGTILEGRNIVNVPEMGAKLLVIVQ